MGKKYYEVRKKYLSDALSYLGFRYYLFTKQSETVYSFENTEKFQYALHQLTLLKNEVTKLN